MKEITKGIIALVIIVGIAASIYAYDIWKAKQPLSLKKGDFAELYYIGYLENHSVFASSFIGGNITYNTSFDNKNYTLLPLKIYMGKNIPHKYPKGWSYADLGTIKRWKISDIKGLYKALLGMKEGEEKIIKLNASQAFGKRPIEGLKFNTSILFGFPAEFEVSAIHNETMDLKWMPYVGQIITMPQQWYNVIIGKPYWIWNNATKVISFNDTHVILETTPNKLDNLTLYPWWNGMSNASYNETKIWITTTPPLGNFTIYYGSYEIPGKVLNVTKDKIEVVVSYGGNETSYKLNRTEVFNRSIELPRIFKEFPKIYLENDLRKIGYSFHELAGETVYFRIRLLKIYRLS